MDESAHALYDGWIKHFGLPCAVLNDIGLDFTGNVLQRLFQHLGIKDLQTTAIIPDQ
jgi:hypothetical protein